MNKHTELFSKLLKFQRNTSILYLVNLTLICVVYSFIVIGQDLLLSGLSTLILITLQIPYIIIVNKYFNKYLTELHKILTRF